ncbi:MAG: lipoprotein [Nitrosomonadales bacterium]|nr:lipoprotein [Nitrosomonadales bacterium]
MRVAGIMLVLALSLQGCGHKGPLYLPAPQAAASSFSATDR